MKKYLQTLHTRPEAHQKRFALIVSGVTTLVIFSFWSLVTFGKTGSTVASTDTQNNLAAVTQALPTDSAQTAPADQVTPFDDLLSGIKASFQSIESLLKNNGQQ